MKRQKINDYILILILVTIILSFPLISTKIVYGNDTMYHLANIEAITKDFLNLNFSKITSDIGYNLGYGGNIFYPKLPHFLTAILNIPFYLLGINVIYAYKLMMINIIFLSGLTMYKYLNNKINDNKYSLFGSIIYMSMPYFMCQIYARNSFNECFLMIFLPLILYSLDCLKSNEYKNFYFTFIIGYVGIVFSHLVMSVYFTILLIIYILLNYKTLLKKDEIICFIKASIIILIIIMPSLTLMIEHKNLGIYQVFNGKLMYGNARIVKNQGLSAKDFIIPKIDPISKIFNFINIIILLVYVFILVKIITDLIKPKKINKINDNNRDIYELNIVLIISLFLSSKYFPYEKLPKLLLSIQFPIRNLIFISLFMTIVCTIGLKKYKDKLKGEILIVLSISSIIIVLPFINKMPIGEINQFKLDNNLGMGSQKEYLSKNASSHQKYYENRNQSIINLKNKKELNYKIIKNQANKYTAEINNITSNTEIELPRFYYLGYKIKYKNKNGKEYNLKYKLDKNGLICTTIDGPGTLTLYYKGTVLYNVLRFIRLCFIIVVIIIYSKKIMQK